MKHRGTMIAVVVASLAALLGAGCTSSNSGAAPGGTTSTSPPGTLIAPGAAGTTPPHDVAVDVAPTPASPDAQKTATDVVASLRAKLPYTDEQIACVVDRLARNQPLLDQTRQSTAEGSAGFGGVVRLAQVCVQAVTFAPQFAENTQRVNGGTLSDTQVKCLTDKYAALPTDVLDKVNQATVNMTMPGRDQIASQMADLFTSCAVPVPK